MLSPSDFNNAVPQFTNGTYASNPLNPQYIAEPSSTDYNRGTEPLQTLPAQWWNWFINKFTGRFNKVNIYVKNLFNELAQLLSLVDMSPDGTEGTPTVGQLKCMFQCEYPAYVKNTEGLVTNTTTVNGHALSSDVTVTRDDLGLGTSATVNTGTAAGCIPTVGTALGTTDGQFLATDASGNLKPSGYSASCFRASSWTPSCVSCAGQSYCVMDYCSNAIPLYVGYAGAGLTCAQVNNLAAFSTSYVSGKTIIKDVSKATVQSWLGLGSNAYNSTAFTTCTGTVTQVKVGTTAYNPSSGVISLPAYPSTPTCVTCARNLCVSFSGVWTGAYIDYDDTSSYLGLVGCVGSSTKGICVCYAKSAGSASSASSASSATTSTCAYRACVLSNAWKVCQASQSASTITNCCSFPILAFGSGTNNSFAVYLAASGSVGIGLPQTCFTSSCHYGIRLF